MFELDHVIVFADSGAPEAEALVDFGLTEGDPNVHPGQGTACRRFFFHNAFLELLWVSDATEVQSELVQPTQLGLRWSRRKSGGSPFGVCMRSAHPGADGPPFPSWEYRPSYLPSPWAIHLAEGVGLSEPLWAFLGFAQRPDAPRSRPQPLAHRAGIQEITHVRITSTTVDSPVAVVSAASKSGGITLASGAEHFMELTFDDSAHGRAQDFRPVLPLVFRW